MVLSLAPAARAGQAPPVAPVAGQATFSVFVRATPVGLERVEVASGPDGGWLITSTGQLSAPITLENQRFELRYNQSWQPTRLAIDGVRAGLSFSLQSTFEGSSARHDIQEGSQVSKHSEPIAPDAIVLPNYFFAAYEALVVRLASAKVGDAVPIHLAPRGQITAHVNDILHQQIKTRTRTIDARIHRITFTNPGRPLPAEVWSDEHHRLVRVSLPSVFLDVAREDIIAVSARMQTLQHPGDEDVHVPAAGFNLAATLTKPVNRTPPSAGWPTVLFVPGSATDRDETLYDIPIFGQLAGALADRGFLVARYDKRGVGQSGGRAESATLRDYADDVQDVVRHLRKRPGVDRNRIVVVGHGEGAWVALSAATRDDEIDGLVLVAAPATTGHELVLEQQRTALDRMSISNAEKQDKVALQHRIHAAVLGRSSWDPVPPELRGQADTPWFRSFLAFDPADVVRRVRQPMLILHGDLDKQILPYHADRLAELARARRRELATDVVRLAGINHLLVSASSGNVEEYATLPDSHVSSTVIEALVNWLGKTGSR